MTESEKDIYEFEDDRKRKLNKPVFIAAAAGVLGFGVIAVSALGLSSIGPDVKNVGNEQPESHFGQQQDETAPEEFAPNGEKPFGGHGDRSDRGHGRFDAPDGRDDQSDEEFGEDYEGGEFDRDGDFGEQTPEAGENS